MWEEWFQDLMCRLLKRLGGDCKDLENEPADEQVSDVDARYRAGFKPNLPTHDSRVKFLADLNDLENGMHDEGSTLTPSGLEMLQDLIVGLRAEVPPSDLASNGNGST